jgi:hypothetical protein
VLLDANTRFFQCCGWTRPEINQKRFIKPYHRYQQDVSEPPVEGAMPLIRTGTDKEEWMACPETAQYPASILKKMDLYRGQCDSIQAVWIKPMADGRLYEVTMTSWISKWEWVEVPTGERRKVPRELTMMWDANAAVCLC